MALVLQDVAWLLVSPPYTIVVLKLYANNIYNFNYKFSAYIDGRICEEAVTKQAVNPQLCCEADALRFY